MDYEPSVVTIAVPVTLGLGAFAAIVLTDGTEDLNWVRFAIAVLVFFGVSWGGAYVAGRMHLSRFRRRLADEDAVHRKAVAAAFRADVEHMTGRPFPTDRTTEQ